MPVRNWAVCIAAFGGWLTMTDAAHATVNLIDIVPASQSTETSQNAEPSLAVDPVNPNNMIAGTFSSTHSGSDLDSPFWSSSNGGASWSSFGSLPSADKTMAWQQDGGAALTVTLNVVSTSPSLTDTLSTFQSGASNFGSAVNTSGVQSVDQPWVRSGPSGQTYVAYNGFNAENANGKSASILVSSNNGATYGAPIVLETVAPPGGQDAPSVRLAVNGSTVYAAFTRWGSTTANDSNGMLFGNSQVVIVKSTDAGGSFSAGVTGATTTSYFANALNTPLTLGQERVGGDIAIAVDPNNANHVVVAYGDANETSTSTGLLQLHVIESTDGGTTWTQKFVTSASVRSALPALSILSNGEIGLLYLMYDPSTDKLLQHLLTTKNDFSTTADQLLGTESNANPSANFSPYLGDFYDMTSVDNTFYGIFTGSNADNGTNALYQNVTFLRDYTGTPGTGTFQVTDGTNPVTASIDPFVFSYTDIPEPNAVLLFGVGLAGLGLQRRRKAH